MNSRTIYRMQLSQEEVRKSTLDQNQSSSFILETKQIALVKRIPITSYPRSKSSSSISVFKMTLLCIQCNPAKKKHHIYINLRWPQE